MDDPRALVHLPPGLPGSGRVRYGAGMALFEQGLISEAQLDVLRDAAAHDGRDPGAVLRALGLPALPAAPRPGAAARIATLADAATDYLLGLDHAGAADVRAGLARRQGPPVPVPPPAPNPVVAHWLGVALSDLGQTHATLARAIAAAAGLLDWITYDAYPPVDIGPDFAGHHAFAQIIGPGAPFVAQDFDMGLFLIAPHVLYRDHHHPAPELYAPLTGPHGWRFGPGRPLIVKPAHQPVWNPPHRPHLTKVGPRPFLSLFVWTGAVDQPAQVIPAHDWPALEALQL